MTQTLVLEAATWTFIPGEMLLRAWSAPKRSVSGLLRHLAAVRWAEAGEIHVNRVPRSTQVSQPLLFILHVQKTLLCNVRNHDVFLKKDLFFKKNRTCILCDLHLCRGITDIETFPKPIKYRT